MDKRYVFEHHGSNISIIQMMIVISYRSILSFDWIAVINEWDFFFQSWNYCTGRYSTVGWWQYTSRFEWSRWYLATMPSIMSKFSGEFFVESFSTLKMSGWFVASGDTLELGESNRIRHKENTTVDLGWFTTKSRAYSCRNWNNSRAR